jgi:hypothetical protein
METLNCPLYVPTTNAWCSFAVGFLNTDACGLPLNKAGAFVVLVCSVAGMGLVLTNTTDGRLSHTRCMLKNPNLPALRVRARSDSN